jgi:hypothetical protein
MEPSAAPVEDCPLLADRTRIGRTRSLAGGVVTTIRLSRALVDTGRSVDLDGLDRIIGLLCAKALDLAPEQGRELVPELSAMLREIDGLAAALTAAMAPSDR